MTELKVNRQYKDRVFRMMNITGTFTPPVRNEETIVPD